jgi:hypothetical protein
MEWFSRAGAAGVRTRRAKRWLLVGTPLALLCVLTVFAVPAVAGQQTGAAKTFTVKVIGWWDHNSHKGNGTASDPHHSGICFYVATNPEQTGSGAYAKMTLQGDGIILASDRSPIKDSLRRVMGFTDHAGAAYFAVGISINKPTLYKAKFTVVGDRGTTPVTERFELHVVRGDDFQAPREYGKPTVPVKCWT